MLHEVSQSASSSHTLSHSASIGRVFKASPLTIYGLIPAYSSSPRYYLSLDF